MELVEMLDQDFEALQASFLRILLLTPQRPRSQSNDRQALRSMRCTMR